MCGIAGLLSRDTRDPTVIRAMTGALAHRGPDDQGYWVDDEGAALGHRRLAVVDLSPAGHQPMHSADGRLVLTFNGEIYNFADLRSELEAQDALPEGGWRGHSDTEVLLQAIAVWGLEPTLAKAAGMFAFGLWDRSARTLTLVRDRFGEKPLYYGWAGGDFLFGSELKALRAHPRFEGTIDRAALSSFIAHTYIPAPLSIYRHVFKLEPGCLLRLTVEAARTPLEAPPEEGIAAGGLSLRRYWSYANVVNDGLAHPIDDEDQALERLEEALARSVRQQSFGDVPVGAFLSGGIDSSTIVALYQKYSSIPVRTFSIGFEDAAFNEADNAKAVATHLGTIHHEQYVTAQQARDVIPLLPSMYDEPFADSSQIPTHLVSRFARQQVTVALTGDGGDELFGGYTRHVIAPKVWKQLQRVPRRIRAAAAGPLSSLPPHFWDRAAGLMPLRRQRYVGPKIRRALGAAATANSIDDIHQCLIEQWPSGHAPVLGERRERTSRVSRIDGASDAARVMYADAVTYLPGDILCKVDRASMAVALETRIPFLDHRVAEVAARIPLHMKIREGRGKHILRALLGRQLPVELFNRSKAGFAVPIGEWLKGPLRGWAEDLLDPRSMQAAGWLDADLVSARWRDHVGGKEDSTAAIWAVLMFEAWMREQRSGTVAAA